MQWLSGGLRSTTKAHTRKEKNEEGQKNNHLGFSYCVSNHSFDYSNKLTIEITIATMLKIKESQNLTSVDFLSLNADFPI